jgi:hypothetical protein
VPHNEIVGDDFINTSAQAARIVGSTTTIVESKTTTPLVPFRKFLHRIASVRAHDDGLLVHAA